MSAEELYLPMLMEFFQDDPLTVTYIRQANGAYNPSTSEYEYTTLTTPCQAIIQDLTKTMNGMSVKFGTEIVYGDKELYLLPPEMTDSYALPLTIDVASDKVLVGNVEYKVVNVKEINPGNKTLVYNLMLRR